MSETVTEPGFTTLYNPATGDPWPCPDPAVANWEAKGWTRAPASEKPLSSMSKPELEEAAAKRGVAVDAGATKAEIADAITAHDNGQEG
jgi:hypothetical protein